MTIFRHPQLRDEMFFSPDLLRDLGVERPPSAAPGPCDPQAKARIDEADHRQAPARSHETPEEAAVRIARDRIFRRLRSYRK